jgi:hypothetical protein
VILPLVYVVKEDANCAPIEAEGDTATCTGLCGVLRRVAPHTLDSLDGFPVHLVGFLWVRIGLVLGGVVAETTAEEFVAARGEQGRLAFIVGTAFIGSVH